MKKVQITLIIQFDPIIINPEEGRIRHERVHAGPGVTAYRLWLENKDGSITPLNVSGTTIEAEIVT